SVCSGLDIAMRMSVCAEGAWTAVSANSRMWALASSKQLGCEDWFLGIRSFIDSVLSMNDLIPKNQSSHPNCFELAKAHIRELAETAVQAPSAQTLILIAMSNPEQT